MPVTLREIAKAAGCSVSTVSRAFAGSEHPVNDVTKERILAIANQLGYRPNVAARGLKTDRTFTIGLVVYNIASPFTPVLIRGIQVANKPYVFVYRLFDGSYTNSVLADDRHGARLAVEHLVKLGHRRIAYINGPHDWNSSKDRLAGYQDVLAQYGIPYDPALVEEGTWEVQSAYPLAKKYLGLPERPTAIFAANDLMALGAIYAIQDAGLNVPKDIAVVGYDDRDIANCSKPTITTICPPSFEMGKLAAQVMVDRLENQIEIKDPIRVQGKLIVRESSGAGQGETPLERYVSHTNPPEPLIRRWRGKNIQE